MDRNIAPSRRQLLLPVRDGGLVEARGRLFTGVDGHAYVRPRMHPDEPRIALPEQAQMDTTPFGIRVMGFEAGAPGSWHTIRGVLSGMSIEVDAVLDAPAEWLDSWEEATQDTQSRSPMSRRSGSLVPTARRFWKESLPALKSTRTSIPIFRPDSTALTEVHSASACTCWPSTKVSHRGRAATVPTTSLFDRS